MVAFRETVFTANDTLIGHFCRRAFPLPRSLIVVPGLQVLKEARTYAV